MKRIKLYLYLSESLTFRPGLEKKNTAARDMANINYIMTNKMYSELWKIITLKEY